MGDEVNNSFTEGQKNVIYKEMLVPLKLKISQILLYDTKVALEFLQEYNEIIENEDMLGNRIIQRITELEFKMQNYMSNDGKEKAFQERSKAILQSIEELKINSIQLTLEEFENKFAKLKTDHEENVENYSFKDREKVEREVYALQASLIMRQVTEGKSADEIQESITEHDKAGLTMFVLEMINNLSPKEGLKDIATKVNNIVMTDKDAVLRPELWNWLNAAERGIKHKAQSQMSQPSTAMIVSPKNKNITLMDRISKVFSKEPTFPLHAIDLRKINIEWLSKYIPKSMLLEVEIDRLSQENREVNDRYVPDSRTLIYQLMQGISDMMWNGSERKYKFIKENGSEFLVRVYESFFCRMRSTTVEFNSGNIRKYGKRENDFDNLIKIKAHAFNETLAYASLLDKVFNTDFQQQLLQEAQDIYIDKKHRLTPVYDNLMLSLKKMLKEYNRTKLDFEATENAKRKKFYEIHGFKEQFKLEDARDEDGTKAKPKRVERAIQPKNHNDDGTEQDIIK